MARKLTGLILLAGFLCSIPGLAQEETPPVDPPGSGEDRTKNVDPLLLEPDELVDLFRSDLIVWPAERGLRAAETIFGGGQETIPYLLGVLSERDYRIKPAVADILSRFGCDQAWEPTRALLSHKGLKNRVKQILTSLSRLRPEETLELCVDLLSGSRRTLRKATYNFLQARRDLSHVKDKLVGLLQSKENDVRRHAFLLLIKRGDVPAGEMNRLALGLVGDDDPRLAAEVVALLTLQGDDNLTADLGALLATDRERIFAFAVMILVSREYKLARSDLPIEIAPRLEGLIASNDPLLKVAAAAGLSSIYRRSSSGEAPAALRSTVIPAFMEVFLGNRYSKDFSCLLDVSVLCLRFLTGDPFDKDLTYWKKWWIEKGVDYQTRQRLLSVNEKEIPSMVVRYRRAGESEPLAFLVAGEAMMVDPAFKPPEGTCFAQERDLLPFVNALYSQGFFKRSAEAAKSSRFESAAKSDQAARARCTASIEVEVDRRTSRIERRGDDDQNFATLEAALLRIFHRNAWQLLCVADDFNTWYLENVSWWNDPEKEVDRTDRFLVACIDAFNFLSDEEVLGCFSWLSGRSDLAEWFDVKKVSELTSRVRGRERVDILTLGTIDLVAIAASQEPDLADQLFQPLTTYIFTLYGEKAFPFLERAIEKMARLDQALDDVRWYARAAAARVLRHRTGSAVPVLVSLLDDGNRAVRIEVLHSLAVIGTAETRVILGSVLESKEPRDVEELVAALDGITAPWAFEMLKSVVVGRSSNRLNALGGLARFDDAEAKKLVLSTVETLTPGSDDWRQAVIALEEAGGETARTTLCAHFVAQPPGKEKFFVALALAGLGETMAVDTLLEAFEEGGQNSPAKDALSLLLVAEFDKETWGYRKLWNENRGKDQAFFLAHTIGCELDQSAPFEKIPIASLVDALDDRRWYVRSAAARILERGAGVDFGAMRRTTSPLEMRQISDAWRNWLQTR